MRITGGKLCGRRIRVPKGSLRPTQDRVREALFSMLGPCVQGARFLDLFAGSGVVGIEAWSRGAETVCLVEKDRRSLPVIKANVAQLCDDSVRVIGCDVSGYLRRSAHETPFDIVFCDPPYRELARGGSRSRGAQNWPTALLEGAKKGGVVRPGGFLIVEQAEDTQVGGATGWSLLDNRKYGGSRLWFFVAKDEEVIT